MVGHFQIRGLLDHTGLNILPSHILMWRKNKYKYAAMTNQKLNSQMKLLGGTQVPK